VDLLLRNPAGYLPDTSQLDLDLPPKQCLCVGPGWLKLSYLPLFGVLMLASFAIEVVARIG
jgi:hypothetical protein